MESDDDYKSLSPPKETSPQVHYRRLKRLKNSDSKPSKDPSFESVDDPILFPQVDFAKLEDLENGIGSPDISNDSDSTEDAILSQESPSQGVGNESEGEMENGSVGGVKKAKRLLVFDDVVIGGVDADVVAAGVDSEGFELGKEINGVDSLSAEKGDTKEENKKRVMSDSGDEPKSNSHGPNEVSAEKWATKKKRSKKGVMSNGDEPKTNLRPPNKRREEKERKAHLKELHAESQRLLRETRDASFKPIPVVQKPISSILEKIRKRKLEISKKAMLVNDKCDYFDGDESPKNKKINLDVSHEEKDEKNVEIILEKETISPLLDEGSSLAAAKVDECKDVTKSTDQESDHHPVSPIEEPTPALSAPMQDIDHHPVSPIEEPTPALRAPVQDTEDLFDDSETVGTAAELNDEPVNSPMEEDFAPLLPMNLKLDSAPVDDSSSDEEADDKENVKPHTLPIAGDSVLPKSDFAKDFIDDEADEEDDSDNDLHRFQENEEAEDIEDLKELNDMIATGYEERPVDNEKRNELHQKWLEQQDEAGTENLMQRLKYGSGLRDTILSDKESETDEEDEEFDDEAKEDSLPRNSARINTKKAKQIILQLLPDKEDAYLSDEDNSMQSRHALSLLIKKEEHSTIVSPADDENSREVFGLIKKVNVVSDNKKKPKAVSFFDSVLKGENSNSSSKSSFLGRVSSHLLPSSRKQGSGPVRSFIFGRDDSNSRSALISEDSSDTVSQEARTTKISTTKYNSSQTKLGSEIKVDATNTSSRTSLLETLKRSSSLSRESGKEDATVDLKSMFGFIAPKKPVKTEGRS